ncbi:hypothetical protein [Vibrio caribbeanicus]
MNWTRVGHIRPLDDAITKYVVVGTLLITIFAFTKLGLYPGGIALSYVS